MILELNRAFNVENCRIKERKKCLKKEVKMKEVLDKEKIEMSTQGVIMRQTDTAEEF